MISLNRRRLALAIALAALAQPLYADSRQKVEFPDMMREHMLANMRDHLQAMTEIQDALGRGDYDKAADLAEQRIGMSSMASHGAGHMAPLMPPAMQEIGTAMHRAASRFARSAQESAVDGDLRRSVSALSEVSAQCVACHTAYRVH
jgi:hypothetical protein